MKVTLKDLTREQGVLIVLLVLISVMSIISNNFFTARNFINILRQVSVVGILACGLTFVLINGSLDLSIGSVLSLAAVFAVRLQLHGILLAILIPLSAGALVGLGNGFLVVRIRANPVVVTLGTLIALEGLVLIYTQGLYVFGTPGGLFELIGKSYVMGIPSPFYFCAGVAALSHFALRQTVLGRQIYAMGWNENAAKASGVNTVKVGILAFVVNGVLAGLAGIIVASRLTSIPPNVGSGYLFDVLAIVFLGGVSLSGGEGTMLKTMIAAFLIVVLKNSLIMMNVPYSYNRVILGLVIISAVGIHLILRRKK